MTNDLHKYLDFAVETAYLAGRLTLGYFQTGVAVDTKENNTPVTEADLKAEQLMRARIEKQFPGHAILGEEYGKSADEGASHHWLIDPIDGTKSFVRGVPLYGVLIALEQDGKIVVGAVYFPALDEMVFAAKGTGCFWNGRPARVSPINSMSQAIVSCTDPHTFALFNRAAEWQRIKEAAYYRVGWTDAYGHALVATGRIEVMLDPIMNAWDCGPFPVILREAGGYFGDWSGNETIYSNEALCTNSALLPSMLALIRGDDGEID